MRSSHVDLYNHDEDAATYDRDVLRSENPIREGYAEVLDWVAQNAGITQDATVVELGSGTGNLTARLPPCRSLVCVDASVGHFRSLGLSVETIRFSTLSWGIKIQVPR